MSSDRPPTSPLQNMLDEAESELSRRLHEACEAEARGVSTESADEIRQLEDTLLAAVMAAERTIAARRHLRDAEPGPRDAATTDATPADATPADAPTAGAPAEPDSTSVREFADETGREWRAWPVTPDIARAHQATRRSLGEFQQGWICFEALDNSGRRRLPGRGRRWSDLAIEDLPRLLAEAITVPPRKTRHPDLPGGGGMVDRH